MPGKTIKEPCCICGKTKEQGFKLQRFDNKVFCIKHYTQMRRYNHILPIEKTRNRLTNCCICGEKAKASIENKEYCQKHYMQMYHHNKILDNTIFDKNRYIDYPELEYTECITLDKNFKESGKVIIDLNKKEEISKHKVYVRSNGNKKYAAISINGQKFLLHRYLLGINEEYSIRRTVDHINGNSLDNRISNLRICHQKDNMKNIKKKNNFVGVGWLKNNKKWTARIMVKYKGIHLGNFKTYEEAVLSRIKAEKQYFGEYGSHNNLYYIINHPSPIEELKKVLKEGV